MTASPILHKCVQLTLAFQKLYNTLYTYTTIVHSIFMLPLEVTFRASREPHDTPQLPLKQAHGTHVAKALTLLKDIAICFVFLVYNLTIRSVVLQSHTDVYFRKDYITNYQITDVA